MLIKEGHMTDAYRTGALLETRFCRDVYVPTVPDSTHWGVVYDCTTLSLSVYACLSVCVPLQILGCVYVYFCMNRYAKKLLSN